MQIYIYIYFLNYFSRKCNLFFYIIGEWILKKINSFIIFNKHKSYILLFHSVSNLLVI